LSEHSMNWIHCRVFIAPVYQWDKSEEVFHLIA
jgi:hypothetical protein